MSDDRLQILRERTRYVPHDVEPRVFERWEQAGIFHPEPGGNAADNYSIAIPPPNVTGALHMGHALNGSIQDVLIRRQRMRSDLMSGQLLQDPLVVLARAGVDEDVAHQEPIDRVFREAAERHHSGRNFFVHGPAA